MTQRARIRSGYKLFPIWQLSYNKARDQILRLWAHEKPNKKGTIQQEDIKYLSPDEIAKEIQSLCNKKGIKTKVDWGIRFISCSGESFFINFILQKKIDSKNQESLIKNLKSKIEFLYLSKDYYQFDAENSIWVRI